MRQCASARQSAAACLGLSTGGAVVQGKGDGAAPMDVVDEGGAVGGGKGNGVMDTGNEIRAVNGNVGAVVGKGKLGTAPEEENEKDR